MHPVRYLTLWPTAACDLDCAYCYRRDRRGGRMSTATALAALDVAAAGGEPFHVQFAGGEPTLVPDVVEAVCRAIRERGLAATVAVQTNAARVDAALARMLARYRVQVGVSLDGPLRVHDVLRGQGAATLRGLTELGRAGVPVRVTAVVTSVNVAHLGELAMLLAAFGHVRGVAVDPLVPLGSARGRADLACTPAQLAAGVEALHLRVRALERLRCPPLQWRELDLVRRALRRKAAPRHPVPVTIGPRPQQAPRGGGDYCHAARGMSLAVAPDGGVFPCSQSVGDPASAAGTVDDIDWDALTRRFGTTRLSGPCHSCALAGVCPGDCPSRVEALGERGEPPACTIYRTLADLERVSGP